MKLCRKKKANVPQYGGSYRSGDGKCFYVRFTERKAEKPLLAGPNVHRHRVPPASLRPSTFCSQTAKEVNCAFATVILHSLVIRHRNHPSCKMNSARSMKGYKWALILTSLALRIESSFCLAHFSIPPPPLLSEHTALAWKR